MTNYANDRADDSARREKYDRFKRITVELAFDGDFYEIDSAWLRRYRKPKDSTRKAADFPRERSKPVSLRQRVRSKPRVWKGGKFMSNVCALLPAACSMSNRTAQADLRHAAQKTHRLAMMPDERRTNIFTENFLEEPMIHDLYLMSATPWLEAANQHHFQHRALTFAEMAASGKRHDKGTKATRKAATGQAKGVFLALIEGVFHA